MHIYNYFVDFVQFMKTAKFLSLYEISSYDPSIRLYMPKIHADQGLSDPNIQHLCVCHKSGIANQIKALNYYDVTRKSCVMCSTTKEVVTCFGDTVARIFLRYENLESEPDQKTIVLGFLTMFVIFCHSTK